LVQEFFEVEDLETFKLVAEQSPLVIRRDPYVFAQYFAGMFFINLTNLEQRDVKRMFDMLRGKMIIVKSLIKASSITEFINRTEKQNIKK